MLNFMVIYSKQFNIQADFVAVHYGHENTVELVELLRKAGYLETAIRFVIDIKHTAKSGRNIKSKFFKNFFVYM